MKKDPGKLVFESLLIIVILISIAVMMLKATQINH